MNLGDFSALHPILSVIGWTVVHSLWEGAGVAVLLLPGMWLMRRRSANARYILLSGAFVLLALGPLMTGIILVGELRASADEGPVLLSTEKAGLDEWAVPAPQVALKDSGPQETMAGGAQAARERAIRTSKRRRSLLAQARRWLGPRVSWLGMGWCFCVTVLAGRNLGGWVVVQRLARRGASRAPEWVRRLCADVQERIGFARDVGLLESERVGSPAVIGWLRPVILLPVSTIVGLTPAQLEAILVHELTHIRRHDYLVNSLQIMVETFLFYHPVVWWVSKRMRHEREHVCDDAAASGGRDPYQYVEALARLEEIRASGMRPAVAADDGLLLARIRRLLGVPVPRGRHAHAWPFAGAMGAILVAAVVGVVVAAEAQLMGAPPGQRVVYFPEDRSLGQLYIRPWPGTGAADEGLRYGAHAGADFLADAQGAVTVPSGMELHLQVAEEAVPDLSSLGYLGEADLQGISFTETSVADMDLQYLVGMTSLRELEFRNTNIGNEGLFYLQGMETVDYLDLYGTPVTDDGLSFISGMTNMRDLNLNGVAVTDEGIAYLEGMTQMECLDLWRVDIHDEGMAHLAGMDQMVMLGLEDTQITDAGMEYLQEMSLLEDLNIENNDIGDAGLAFLEGLAALRRLNVMDTQITDDGLRHLARMAALEAVYLPVQIGPEGIACLADRDIGGRRGSLEAGARKQVRIVDAVGGEPVKHARFELVFVPDDEPKFLAGDSTGQAVFYLPESEQESGLRLTVRAEGYVPVQLLWEERVPDDLLVELARGTVIGGIVVDESGNPIEGASVSMPMVGEHDWEGEGNLDYAETTDAEGRWRCDVAPADLEEFWLRLSHTYYGKITYEADRLSPQALRDLSQVTVMGPGLVLAGWVVDEAGKPVAGARITEYVSNRGKRRPGFIATKRGSVTDDEGWFELGNCSVGAMVVKVHAAGFTPAVRELQIAAGMEDVLFTLDSTELLRGRVVDQSGTPVEGVSITTGAQARPGLTVVSWQGQTDDEGRFQWNQAPREAMAYRFFKRGYAPLVQELRPNKHEESVVTLRDHRGVPDLLLEGTAALAESRVRTEEHEGERQLDAPISSPLQERVLEAENPGSSDEAGAPDGGGRRWVWGIVAVVAVLGAMAVSRLVRRL